MNPLDLDNVDQIHALGGSPKAILTDRDLVQSRGPRVPKIHYYSPSLRMRLIRDYHGAGESSSCEPLKRTQNCLAHLRGRDLGLARLHDVGGAQPFVKDVVAGRLDVLGVGDHLEGIA